jgi:hypothetical protein
MLRLVPPPGTGQEARRPRRRTHLPLPLTDTERAQFRTVLRNLRAAYGTWECLAAATDVSANVLCSVATGKMPASGNLILIVARVAGMTVERVLCGKLDVAGRCPTCGRST